MNTFTMAPHDNTTSNTAINLSEMEREHIICSDTYALTNADEVSCSSHDRAECALFDGTEDLEQHSSPTELSKPQIVGILKQPHRYSTHFQNDSNEQQQAQREDGIPSYWPTHHKSVHFVNDHTDPSQSPPVVTLINYRPFTEESEISKLYYTAVEFNQFKREYRALLKTQRRRKLVDNEDVKNKGGLIPKSSFWTSKVQGRFDSSNSTNSQPKEELEYCSKSSNAGVFSSVFDVAKGAVSVFSGSSNYSYYQNAPMSSKRQQQLLVDTLYSNLF